MFALILTIIAIVIATVLAIATIYYGGTLYTGHGKQAKAAQVVLEGQQISAAVDIYRAKNEGALPPAMTALTAGGIYLTSAPNNDWTFATDYVVYPMTDLETCKRANTALGLVLTDIPLCSAVTGKTICCQK